MLRGALAGGFCSILGAFQAIFQWLQKATLGTSLPSNAPQRPGRSLCGILGAFQTVFSWLQTATLGTSSLEMLRGALESAGSFCSILGAFQAVL